MCESVSNPFVYTSNPKTGLDALSPDGTAVEFSSMSDNTDQISDSYFTGHMVVAMSDENFICSPETCMPLILDWITEGIECAEICDGDDAPVFDIAAFWHPELGDNGVSKNGRYSYSDVLPLTGQIISIGEDLQYPFDPDAHTTA